MQWLVPYFADLAGIPFPKQTEELSRSLIYFVITIIISALSWYLIELPISRFKNRVFYSSPKKECFSQVIHLVSD
jgi:peptidoglycan/LPS O-acetylase OafA/YrhL